MIAAFSSADKPIQLPLPLSGSQGACPRPHLGQLAHLEASLPPFVRESPVALKYLRLLGALDWVHFPERASDYPWPGPKPHPRAAYVAAFLVKLHEPKTYMSDLRDYLVEHPALVWLLGFKLEPSDQFSWGFEVEASLPTARHFGRVLRELPNDALQFLLDSTVQLIQAELPPEANFGQAGSLDTKHILAWVQENNPKAYVKESDRLDKERQPAGDPTASSVARRRPISRRLPPTSRPRQPTPRPPRPRTRSGRPTSLPAMSTTGAMLRASWPPKSLTGGNSCWPN